MARALFCVAALAVSSLDVASAIRLPSVQRMSLAGPQPPLPQPGNTTAAMYSALRRDFLFFERLTGLCFKALGRLADSMRAWVERSIGFPPRVMVVTLTGVIAADDEVRYSSEALMCGTMDELLLSSEDGGFRRPQLRGRHSGSLINLDNCERLLERAFAAHGARAVVVVINSPGGSPAQSSMIYQVSRALASPAAAPAWRRLSDHPPYIGGADSPSTL